MIDMSYIAAHKQDLKFDIIDRQGIWKYSRSYGDARSMRYVFWRLDRRNNVRRVEISLSCKQVQDKVFVVNENQSTFKVAPEMMQAPLIHLRSLRKATPSGNSF